MVCHKIPHVRNNEQTMIIEEKNFRYELTSLVCRQSTLLDF